jgi:hypothetical protein
MATIITKNSQTASAVPSAASLAVGELAVNTADGKLYTEHTGGVVKEIIPSTVVDGGITTAKIADGAITTAKIAAGAVITDDLANSAVTVAKISATGTPSSTTFLRGDGSWTAPAGGGFTGNFQAFTSSGTFNVPAGVSRVKVTVIGAGGNGGNAVQEWNGGGGGGAGGYVVNYVNVTPGGTATVSVGTNGGTRTSSFSGASTLTATGGNNGNNAIFNNTNPVWRGTDAPATIFGLTYYEGGIIRDNNAGIYHAGSPMSTTTNTVTGGDGGCWSHGFGAAGASRGIDSSNNQRHNAIGYGAGGGGGSSYNGSFLGGGTGANGLVIVEW